MPGPSEFDSDGDGYREAVDRSIAFSGADHEFFTRAKARELLRTAARRLGDPRQISVLDIGCGPGETDRLLERRVARLAGVDTSAAMVEAARKRNPWAEYRISEGDAPLPFSDGAFDLTFAICVLHHVEPPQRPALISEAVRVTRPGGRW